MRELGPRNSIRSMSSETSVAHACYRGVPLLPYTCAHASCVRPLPQPTVASSEAAERPRTVSRVVLTVLVQSEMLP